MAAKYWLKLYHEMIDDPKVARLPDSSYRRFIECLLLAGELNEDGYLPTIADMAWRLRLDETSLTADMSRLANSQLVEIKENGRWFVTSFEKRQAGLTKAEYMKRLRDERQTSYQDVTKPVTNSNADKIRIDTDLDKDKKKSDNTFNSSKTIHNQEYVTDSMQEFITELAKISKETYCAMTTDNFNDAAIDLHGLDADKNDVSGFLGWWLMDGNHYYDGKPYLKSIIKSWTDYMTTKDMIAKAVNGDGSYNV